MNRWLRSALPLVPAVALLLHVPSVASGRSLGVEVWTDRGDDAVYQPGEPIQVKARSTDDAYLLVYEIDSEGHVRVLFPFRGNSGFVEGRRTYRVPPENSRQELVVQGPVGQGYIVAISSRERFHDLPWYLLPYDSQADNVGYEGEADDEEGITKDGQIVGDPFVAMERIRRRVLLRPTDADDFSSAYASYYVHNEVRYPRYVCYDCHRPNRWAWWDGFDPYYARCSVFDFRVNWRWGWGTDCWFGNVPYYLYVYRYDCPPAYRAYYNRHQWCSSWNGWSTWNSMWGGHLRRYKSPPPRDYTPPPSIKGVAWRQDRPLPPGFIDPSRTKPGGVREGVPIGRRLPGGAADDDSRSRGDWRTNPGNRERGPGLGVDRMPGRRTVPGDDGAPGRGSSDDDKPAPRREPIRYEPPNREPESPPPPRREAPRYDPPRRERDDPPPPPREAPRYDPPRRERDDPPPPPREAPRNDPPRREEPNREPAPRERQPDRGGQSGYRKGGDRPGH